MKTKIDLFLTLIVSILLVLSFLNLYSASYNFSGGYFAKQLIWLLISLFVGIIVYFIGIRRFISLSLILYILALLLLIAVLLLPQPGARRWLHLGFFNIQPSEIVKFILPLFLVSVFNYWEFKSSISFLLPLLFTLLPALLIAKEPDLGGALLLFPALIAFFILKKVSWRKTLPWIVIFLIALPLLYSKMEPYQKKRLLTFLNPNLDPLGSGYTILQSKVAVGSGRIFGKGWLNGVQGQLRFLPECHTDFIFPVFAEEWGFGGVIFLLLLYFLMLRRMQIIADNSKDSSITNLLYLFLVTISFQIILNIGMAIGVFPIVGIPLPFFSYGGSDLIVIVVILSLFLKCSREE